MGVGGSQTESGFVPQKQHRPVSDPLPEPLPQAHVVPLGACLTCHGRLRSVRALWDASITDLVHCARQKGRQDSPTLLFHTSPWGPWGSICHSPPPTPLPGRTLVPHRCPLLTSERPGGASAKRAVTGVPTAVTDQPTAATGQPPSVVG